MYLPTAVRPATKFEITLLVVKREPCNVYLAGALKDAWRDVEAAAVARDHHVRLVGPVELLVGAVFKVLVVSTGSVCCQCLLHSFFKEFYRTAWIHFFA